MVVDGYKSGVRGGLTILHSRDRLLCMMKKRDIDQYAEMLQEPGNGGEGGTNLLFRKAQATCLFLNKRKH